MGCVRQGDVPISGPVREGGFRREDRLIKVLG